MEHLIQLPSGSGPSKTNLCGDGEPGRPGSLSDLSSLQEGGLLLHRYLIAIAPPPPSLQAKSLLFFTFSFFIWISFYWSTRKVHTNRPKVILFSHFYNEEMLLPFWIDHHKHMFDEALLLNFNSTDRSVDIIRSQAPAGWKVYHWASDFDFVRFRTEFMNNEKLYPDAWKIFLTTTEFLVHDDLSTTLMLHPMPSAFRFRSYIMIGDDSEPLVDKVPLLQQRHVYTLAPLTHEFFHGNTKTFNVSDGKIYFYSRMIHSFDSMEYTEGLHEAAKFCVDSFSAEGFIAKFAFTPWPEAIDRKLQIASRIPEEYLDKGWATHHRDNLNTSRMEEQRKYLLEHTGDFSKRDRVSVRGIDHRMFSRMYT